MVSIDDLKRGLLFTRLTDAQLQRVAAHACLVKREAGTLLFEQQEPAKRFYLLLEGQIKLFRLSPDGQEKVIEIITPPHAFAEALMFLEHPHYPLGAQVLRDSRLIAIDSADFSAMLRDSAETCLVLLADLSQRLHGLVREIDHLTLHSATSRVADYLNQQVREDRREFELTMSKGVLASLLSVTPETFSRILKQFTSKSIIKVSGRRVEVLDKAALEEAANG
jgi:CRP-like cAMP-binding protein